MFNSKNQLTMKAKIYLTLIALLVVLTVSSQVKKGTIYLNGLNLLSSQIGKEKYTDSYNNNDYSSKTNFTSFAVGPFNLSSNLGTGNNIPGINYCFTDQFSGGISVMLSSVSMKDEEYKYNVSVFMIGPSARFYLLKEGKVIPFTEGKLGFGSMKSKSGDNDSDKTNLSGWYLGTGATWFFKPNTGIEFTLGYQNLTTNYDDSTSDSKYKNSGVNIGIGVLIGF